MKHELKYEIGQILFVVPHKETIVFPVQVVEEIVKRTMNGAETNYIVAVKVGDAMKQSRLDDLKGEIFDTPEQVETVLSSRANLMIKKMVENARVKSSEWFVKSVEGAVTPQEQGDLATIEIDGKQVKVKLPDVLK